MACVLDGSDYKISAPTSYDYKNYTWAVKNHMNSIRVLHVVSLNCLPVLTIPLYGYYATGRHNDSSTFDDAVAHNLSNINEIFPPCMLNY